MLGDVVFFPVFQANISGSSVWVSLVSSSLLADPMKWNVRATGERCNISGKKEIKERRRLRNPKDYRYGNLCPARVR